MEREPTHHISRELQAELIEAKEWYDERQELPMHRSNMSDDEGDAVDAQWSDSGNRAIELLEGIVELIEETWGFAEPLRKATS